MARAFIYFLVPEAIFSLAAEISSHWEFSIGSAQLTEQTALQSLTMRRANITTASVAGWMLLLMCSDAY